MLKSLFGDLDAWGKLWLYIGLGTLVFAAGMAIEYGLSVSVLHAGFLAFLSLVTAFGPHAAHSQWERGKRAASIAIAACLPMLFVMEFQSHAAYTAGLRGKNIADATVQNSRYDMAQDTVVEDKDTLAKAKAELAALKAKRGWSAVIKAEAYRDQIALAQKEIDLETARGGCKIKCAARMKDKSDLELLVADIEAGNALQTKIEATQARVDAKREKAATTEFVSSSVDHQNKFLAKLTAMVGSGRLKASEFQEEGAQQFVNLSMAITATGLPALALFIAGLYRRQGYAAASHSYAAAAAPRDRAVPSAAVSAPVVQHIASPAAPMALTLHTSNGRDDAAHEQLARLRQLLGTVGDRLSPRTA